MGRMILAFNRALEFPAFVTSNRTVFDRLSMLRKKDHCASWLALSSLHTAKIVKVADSPRKVSQRFTTATTSANSPANQRKSPLSGLPRFVGH